MRNHTLKLTDNQWAELMSVLIGEAETLVNSCCKYQRKEGRTLCLIINKIRTYKTNTSQ